MLLLLVQVWHRSNWHWYLKFEQLHTLPDSAGSLLASWDDTRHLRLHLLAGSGAYTVLDFDWSVSVSARGTAAVVDGHQLLITPLRSGSLLPSSAHLYFQSCLFTISGAMRSFSVLGLAAMRFLITVCPVVEASLQQLPGPRM